MELVTWQGTQTLVHVRASRPSSSVSRLADHGRENDQREEEDHDRE